MYNEEMDIDFERLRKKLFASKFADGFMIRGIGVQNSIGAFNASPEELLSMARRAGINLDDFKLKK